MEEEKLKRLAEEWQRVLGLQDWRIKLFPNCRPEEMGDPEADGFVDYQESTKTARIDLLDPTFYGNRAVEYDVEETLLHELLHLKLSLLFEGDKLLERVAHQWVDDFARALVWARRAGNGQD